MVNLLTLSNDLTFDTVESSYRHILKACRDKSASHLCIDLEEVKRCDSAGLALLIEAKRLCKQYYKQLEIKGISSDIQALAIFCGVEVILHDN